MDVVVFWSCELFLLVGFLPFTGGSGTCASDPHHSGHTLAYG